MRKTTGRALLLLTFFSITTIAVAQDEWRVSVLAAEIASVSDGNAGVGLALSYAINPRWGVELAASSQSYTGAYTAFTVSPNPQGPSLPTPFTTYRSFRVHPVELLMTRHFFHDARVSPYVRAGARYVDAPDDPPGPEAVDDDFRIPAREGYGLSNRSSFVAGAGLQIRLTANTSIRADVAHSFRDDGVRYDPATRGALGLSWRF